MANHNKYSRAESSAPITKVTNRLKNVRKTGPGRYVACCPAHSSKSRSSLSIREGDCGTVLMHDFGGCSLDEILVSIDLDQQDLFVASVGPHVRMMNHSTAPRAPTRIVARALAEEGLIAMTIAADLAAGRPADTSRLSVAAGRLQTLLDALQ